MTDLLACASVLDRAYPVFAAELRAATQRFQNREWSVLVSGLCSVGKSSFVSALWGDSDLLPTAVRDCTQTNTLIRQPAFGEPDHQINLKYLDRVAAIQFALKGLAVHRLTDMLQEFHGLALPRFDEMIPDVRLHYIAAESRRIYSSHSAIMVLNEPLIDELEQLENLIEFMDSSDYKPGASVAVRWDERRDHLMGLRRPDGRLTGTGRLMALEHVELVRATQWHPANGLPAPELIDTPWIPALHNARREDLILDQAARADVLLVLALPQRYECENWLLTLFRKRPEIAKTTLVIFNQADTCDPRTLFSRDGFSGIFEDNRERLVKLGINPANILVSCARLRFLQNALNALSRRDPGVSGPLTPFGSSGLPERIARLEKVLTQMREQARSRPEGDLKSKLLPACDPSDAGVETVRKRLEDLTAGIVFQRRQAALVKMIADFDAVDLTPIEKSQWTRLRTSPLND